jgi:membrane fusion protein (multidrug efflux system)
MLSWHLSYGNLLLLDYLQFLRILNTKRTLMIVTNKRLLSLAFCSFFLFSCKEQNQPKEQVAPEVMTVSVIQKSVPVYGEYVGETYGKADVAIQPQVDGTIIGIHFTEGSIVSKGQLLYTLDDETLRNKVELAEARHAQATTMMVKAKADLDRVEPLAAMKALSQRELDAAKAAYEAAKSEVEIAFAAQKNAKIDLGDATIESPITGIIGISKLQVGDHVGKLNLGEPLNMVSSVDQIRVRFTIGEDEYLEYARRSKGTGKFMVTDQLPITLLLSDGTEYEQKGSINFTNRQIDPTTGSLLVQALFPNSNQLLRPGQFVKVRIQKDLYPDAIVVPQQTINQLQSKYQVFIVDDSSKIQTRLVEVGLRVGSNWIVTDGLKPGEQVAIVGSMMLKPAMQVRSKKLSWNSDSTDIK